MTWVPNELEGYDFVVIEFLHRLSEPRGWLVKLWECLVPGGMVIILTPRQGEQQRDAIQAHIKKW